MSINIREIIDSGREIDWSGYAPRDRAWLYIEKYKPGWLVQCRQLTNNWDEARDLFGDTIIIKSLHHAERYDESYGTTFPTWMYANLSKELLKAKGATVLKRNAKRRHVTVNLRTIFYSPPEKTKGSDALGLKGHTPELITEIVEKLSTNNNGDEADNVNLSLSMQYALDKLKQDDEMAYNIFVDFVLNGYKKNMLAARYRCSQWLVSEYIDAAKRRLARCLTE